MSEMWREIPGTDGMYEVNDDGRIRSWKTHRGNRAKTSHPLKPMAKNKLGHQMVFINNAGKRKSMLVHRAVLAAFVGPGDGLQGRHLDGNPLNNNLSNLAYGTQSDNELDKIRHGRHNHANKTHCAQGHEFTPENTIVTPRQRRCRICRRAIERQRDARRRARRRANG